jgi:hypothetical protein
MITVKRQRSLAPFIREKLLPTDSTDESDSLQSVDRDGQRIDFHSRAEAVARLRDAFPLLDPPRGEEAGR